MMDALQELAEMKITVTKDGDKDYVITLPGCSFTGRDEKFFVGKEHAYVARAIGQLPEMVRLVDFYNGTEFKRVAAAIRGPEPEPARTYYDKIIEYGNRGIIRYKIHGDKLEIAVIKGPAHEQVFYAKNLNGKEDACHQGVEWLEKCGMFFR